MVRDFVVDVSGQRTRLTVDWDVTFSGGGSIQADGREVLRWSWGAKWPGVRRTIQLQGHELSFVYTLVGFDIDLTKDSSIRCLEPPLPAGYGPNTASSKVTLGLVIGFLVLLALAGIALPLVWSSLR